LFVDSEVICSWDPTTYFKCKLWKVWVKI